MEDNNRKDFYDYTIVMDGDYKGPNNGGVNKDMAAELEKAIEDKYVAEKPRQEQTEETDKAERLYFDYERMCFKEPTTLDRDDIYPHSYYWRIGDRYDQDKLAVLEEALREGKKIEETDAYVKYTEKLKHQKFSPDSWD